MALNSWERYIQDRRQALEDSRELLKSDFQRQRDLLNQEHNQRLESLEKKTITRARLIGQIELEEQINAFRQEVFLQVLEQVRNKYNQEITHPQLVRLRRPLLKLLNKVSRVSG